MKKLLEVKNQKKSKQPKFDRHDSNKKSKLNGSWKRARGIQNKVRLSKKGYRRSPKVGYGTPLELKGSDREGLLLVVVKSVSDLEGLDNKKHALIVAKVGMKRKLEIITKALELNLKITNIKNAKDYSSKVEEVLKSRKSKRSSNVSKKETKSENKENKSSKEDDKKVESKNKEEKSSKAESKPSSSSESNKMTDEEKRLQDKKEKDKVLTKRQ